MEIKHDGTKLTIDIFKSISAIPRCSKNEEKICEWLELWAKENGLESKSDEAGNVLIKVPATKGFENKPVIVLQSHVDMVCEKTPESKHDFEKDPIELVFGEDGWITAKDTSLGADNGIGMAISMAIAKNKKIHHPPLELLFTVDEETGLTGALALKEDFVEGRILLNLDSEEVGEFTIGCAGGRDTSISLEIIKEEPSDDLLYKRISVGGLLGGHSGINISDGRANAIQLIARLLDKFEFRYNIADLKGGSAHNAIPRDAYVDLGVYPEDAGKLEVLTKEFSEDIVKEFTGIEKNITFKIEEIDSYNEVVAYIDSVEIVEILIALPHGIFHINHHDKSTDTSNNLATACINGSHFEILTSQRGAIRSRLDFLTRKIEGIATLAGGESTSSHGYPSWAPDYNSNLLKHCIAAYSNMFGEQPLIQVIHAGLECGIIGDKYPGMEMISMGPNLKFPHSPDERLELNSIDIVWDFLVELFNRF